MTPRISPETLGRLPRLNPDAINRLLRDEKVPLGSLIDTSFLVTRHELKKVGVGPETIWVKRDYEEFNAGGGMFGITLGAGILRDMTPEEVYVLIAHETGHVLEEVQEYRGTVRKGAFSREEVSEGHARFWEATQGTRFGWDETDYDTWVRKLVRGAEQYDHFPYHKAAKELKERPGVFFAVRRRPQARRPAGLKVAVRRHLRHPPKACLCHRSKTVDRVRRKMVRRLS